jgi:hypothetical protein
MTTPRTPTLAEVIRVALERRVSDLFVSMPGRVQTYYPATQTADVLPLLRKTRPNPSPGPDDADDVAVPLPVLVGVPVVFPGSGAWRLTFPVSAGDEVLLVWSDRSLDSWKSNGAEGDPGGGNHSLGDAVALVGLVAPGVPRAATATDRLSLGQDGGTAVEVLPARINLGVGASQALVLGGSFSTHMTALATALQALQTAITPLMLPPAAAAAKAAALAAYNAATQLANDISSNNFTT